MIGRYVRYKRDQGTANQLAVVFEGRRWIYAVTIEPNLIVRKVRIAEAKFMKDFGDVKDGARRFLDVASRNGASERATQLLQGALNG